MERHLFAAGVLVLAGCAKGPHAEPARHGRVVELSEASFEDMVSKGTVLVDFWAHGCQPCNMQAPILEEVAERFAGKVMVCKLNAGEAGGVANRFNIQAVPTLILFKDGVEAKRMVGLQKEATLVAEVEAALGG